MIQIVRSELIRIWRPSFRYGGIGTMAGFAALISVFIFTSTDDPADEAQAGPAGASSAATSPTPEAS